MLHLDAQQFSTSAKPQFPGDRFRSCRADRKTISSLLNAAPILLGTLRLKIAAVRGEKKGHCIELSRHYGAVGLQTVRYKLQLLS